MNNQKHLQEQLINYKIQPSIQRIEILAYLVSHYHPTAEEVYTNLQAQVSTISKATVYNTLNLFVASGLVKQVAIDDRQMRYDIITTDHGHFQCDVCGEIYDFPIDRLEINLSQLADFKINQKFVYLKGICARCNKNKVQEVKNERN
ncbi:MAG: Fur family transcriptional regulator [Bacilli bacterium]